MKTFVIAVIAIFSFSSFAINNSLEKVEVTEPYLIPIYCDGVYAGDIYGGGGFTMEDIIEMAQAMCD